jgi:hypothetical protein
MRNQNAINHWAFDVQLGEMNMAGNLNALRDSAFNQAADFRPEDAAARPIINWPENKRNPLSQISKHPHGSTKDWPPIGPQ